MLKAKWVCLINYFYFFLYKKMSIGTLLTYSTVCICVLILRYQHTDLPKVEYEATALTSTATARYSVFKKLFAPENKMPTRTSSNLVKWLTSVCIICIASICFILNRAMLNHWYMILLLNVLAILLVISIVIIWCQPQISNINTFKVNFDFFGGNQSHF